MCKKINIYFYQGYYSNAANSNKSTGTLCSWPTSTSILDEWIFIIIGCFHERFVYFRFNRKSAVSLNFCQLFVYIFFRWNDRSIWISKSSFHSTWSIWRIAKTSSPSLFQYFSIKSYWRRWRNLSCLKFSWNHFHEKFFLKLISRKNISNMKQTSKNTMQ